MTNYRPGELIREARRGAHLTQQDVADKLHVDRSLISQIERGRPKRPLEPTKARLLSEMLKVPPLVLLAAMGYDLGFEDIEAEQVAMIPQAYRLAGDDAKSIVRLALKLEARPSPE